MTAAADRAAPTPPTERAGVTFWIAFVIGAGVMAYGIRGLVTDLEDSSVEVAKWVIGADLLHDLVLAPIAVAVGWTINRIVPSRWRAPLQAGLAATGVTLLLGWPGWRGYGRHLVPDNPSVQPLDYTTAILTVLAVIWTAALIWLGLRLAGDRRAAKAARSSAR